MSITRFLPYTILTAALLVFCLVLNAQTGKGLVFNGTNQMVSCPVTGFPAGASARTLEFWVRATPKANNSVQHIISWGKSGSSWSMSDAGAAFGVTAKSAYGRLYLGFWGYSRDVQFLEAPLPDDDWHFVALTYNGTRLRCYLDGEMRADSALSLNTVADKLYIGNRAPINNAVAPTEYFAGCIRDIAVWSHARTQYQIQMDMIPWPAITGNEAGLVTYISLNEGSGNTFSDKKKVVSGTIGAGATWSKPIVANPNPVDEGIWFLIQNKDDLDRDTGKTAKRMAMMVDDNGSVGWAAVPLRGDYNRFLWRVVKDSAQSYIVNKKLGMNIALDGRTDPPVVGRYSRNNEGQQWMIAQADVGKWGTNTYTLTNRFLTNAKALMLKNGKYVVFANRAEGQASLGWVLQPMGLTIGYHIPVSATANGPITQELTMPYNFKVYATNTVRDWSVLNGHLIWKNMLNAVSGNAGIASLNGGGFIRKEIQIISRYDQSQVVSQYPRNLDDADTAFDKEWHTDYRGGSYNNPQRKVSITVVTEEMMCQRGVFSRGYNDRDFREFDQTVHEFGHALDKTMGIDKGSFPAPSLSGSKAEAVAAAIQAWFNNNNSYSEFPRTRGTQRAVQPAHYDRVKQYLNILNTWMPPRWLRDQPDGRVELKDGDTLNVGEWIYSSPPYGTDGLFARLTPDGNLIVATNDSMSQRWNAVTSLGIPTRRVKYIVLTKGVLRMKDAAGGDVYVSANPPVNGARLVVGTPLPEATQGWIKLEPKSPNSWIRIVDSAGRVIWEPGSLAALKDGDTLKAGNRIHSSDGVFARLQWDGNLAVSTTNNMDFQWGMINHLGIPTNSVKYVVLSNGVLRMKNAAGGDVFVSPNAPVAGARLVVGKPPSYAPNSWIRIVGPAGNAIWSPDDRAALKEGDTLKVGNRINSANGALAILQPDGNLEIVSTDKMAFKWNTVNSLRIPRDSVRYIVLSNGVLRMKNAAGKDVYASTNAPVSGTRLIVADPLPFAPNSWIRIVGTTGKVIWEPGSQLALEDGDTLKAGNAIYSADGVLARLQSDGDFAVSTTDSMSAKWSTFNNLRLLRGIKYMVMSNGVLRMKNAASGDMYVSTNTPVNGARLVIAKPLEFAPNSWIRIVDPAGKVIWEPGSRVALKDGDTLKTGDAIYSTDGVLARLQPDGNLVVSTADKMAFKWGTINHLNVPANSVKYIVLSNGVLRMKNAAGEDVYVSPNAPVNGARLVVGTPLKDKPNSWIRIVDATGTLLWAP